MPDLLILFSPPRSFSSVVSTVIGQHPEMYGLPELHLFSGDTILEVFEFEARHGNRFGPPGLLRTLAELHDGAQTTTTVLKALAWLDERQHWSVAQLFDHLIAEIDRQFHPKIIVEKSPLTVMQPEFIERAYQLFPNAYYLHLMRHPVTARRSWEEYRQTKRKLSMSPKAKQAFQSIEDYRNVKKQLKELPDLEFNIDCIQLWLRGHSNIINFLNTLPLGQSMRVKGEDVLSEPDLYLPQIAEWLGLRTDSAAVDAMKHPEQSPYACLGPKGAFAGNDTEFMASPELRPGKVSQPNLQESLEKGQFEWAQNPQLVQTVTQLSQQMGYL